MSQDYDDLVFEINTIEQNLIEKIEEANQKFLKDYHLKMDLRRYYASEDGVESMSMANRVIESYHNLLSE